MKDYVTNKNTEKCYSFISLKKLFYYFSDWLIFMKMTKNPNDNNFIDFENNKCPYSQLLILTVFNKFI